MARPDFLRHIINPRLAEYSRTRKKIASTLDEIRRLIAMAEDKYEFSVFGGDPNNLGKYIQSDDFDLVVSALKSINALDIIEDILKEVLDKYSDLPDVVNAAKKRLSEIKSGILSVSELRKISEQVSRILPEAKIDIINENSVKIEYNGLKAILTTTKEGAELKIKIDKTIKYSEKYSALAFLKRLYGLLKTT